MEPTNQHETHACSSNSESAFADLALAKVRPLFTEGQLWHTFQRFVETGNPGEPRIDRLAQILKNGLVAPAHDDQHVVSDLKSHLVVTGLSVPYDSLVFIHRTNQYSGFYLDNLDGQIVVFLSDLTPVTAPEDMPEPWVAMCQDEVYARVQVTPEMIEGLMIMGSRDLAEGVVTDFLPVLRKLTIPVYAADGELVWPRVPSP